VDRCPHLPLDDTVICGNAASGEEAKEMPPALADSGGKSIGRAAGPPARRKHLRPA
jgi:hypothetical protein